jgi:hypothetical protein
MSGMRLIAVLTCAHQQYDGKIPLKYTEYLPYYEFLMCKDHFQRKLHPSGTYLTLRHWYSSHRIKGAQCAHLAKSRNPRTKFFSKNTHLVRLDPSSWRNHIPSKRREMITHWRRLVYHKEGVISHAALKTQVQHHS